MTLGQSQSGRSAGVTRPQSAKLAEERRSPGAPNFLDDFDGDLDAAAAESHDLLGVVNQLQRQRMSRTLPQRIAEKLSQRILLGLIPPRSRLIER